MKPSTSTRIYLATLLLIGGLALVMLFPAISLWLPGTMHFR